jgi:hypothetical protein
MDVLYAADEHGGLDCAGPISVLILHANKQLAPQGCRIATPIQISQVPVVGGLLRQHNVTNARHAPLRAKRVVLGDDDRAVAEVFVVALRTQNCQVRRL